MASLHYEPLARVLQGVFQGLLCGSGSKGCIYDMANLVGNNGCNNPLASSSATGDQAEDSGPRSRGKEGEERDKGLPAPG